MITELRTFNGKPMWVDVIYFGCKANADKFAQEKKNNKYFIKVVKHAEQFYSVEIYRGRKRY